MDRPKPLTRKFIRLLFDPLWIGGYYCIIDVDPGFSSIVGRIDKTVVDLEITHFKGNLITIRSRALGLITFEDKIYGIPNRIFTLIEPTIQFDY